MSWWTGDGNASDLLDGNHGTPMSGAGFAPGEVLQSFDLDGVNDFIEIPDSPNLYPAGSFSIEAWARTSASPPFAAIYYLYDCGHSCPGGVANSAYSLYLESGMPRFGVRDSAGGFTNGQAVQWEEPISDGEWHHIVGTRDVEASRLSLYVDGTRVAGAPLRPEADGPLGNDDQETDPVTIGAKYIAASSDLQGFFTGQIDEVILVDRALSACEVKEAYLSGSAGRCKGDTDGDGSRDVLDNCPYVSNSGQENTDGDRAGNACDCVPSDPGVFAAPNEVGFLEMGPDFDKSKLDWCSARYSAGTATVYDVSRGVVNQLPVGTGGSETCLPPGSFPDPRATDPDNPPASGASWYLVRGRNACGVGTYGFRGHNGVPGAERITSVCP